MSKKKSDSINYEPVDASPVKSFFVSMLTRDIKLEEAILDLLDNCIDGILRIKKLGSEPKPYEGYYAEIRYSKDTFSIMDNCGGIPWDLHDYAFRMGRSADRPDDVPGAVGVYGIGMKRAIFKMGKSCLITTQSKSQKYEIEITPDWIRDEKDWQFPVRESKSSMEEDGTTIFISKLYPGIAANFSDNARAFKKELDRLVATHYAFIIDKGFVVKINRDTVKPSPTKLIFTKKPRGKKTAVVQPFIFKTKVEDVDIFLTVGFTRPIPSQDEANSDLEEKRYSSLDAGWTVLCNERAVLYCDRTEMTGWGEAGVPRYHNQFIAISGIVEFKADNALKLPTTTTKRGIDASSSLYLQVKNKMREGMRIFTDYTNKWKGLAEESRKHIEAGESLSFDEIKTKSKSLKFSSTKKTMLEGHQYKPSLPSPKKIAAHKRRISYIRDIEDIKCVADYLFNQEDKEPSEVGEKCFDLILKEAKK